ncbi:MAG: ATP-binding cassette domain-containing protein [Actinobacteria bacterium]|nr:ATP-binding cassette domain-containing protein [Actinomycetota bacterium]
MIEVSNLTKRFGRVLAVEDASFSAQPGRVTGFLGPNGAGKTTTLRAIVGLLQPTSGSATVLGKPYRALDQPSRCVGAVLETSNFHPGRSGRNHLRVLAVAAGIPRSRAEDVLKLVELDDAAGRRVRGYSLGMRQRLALAGALLGEPDVLVLDEPANGLDPAGIRWLRDLLRSAAAEGRTVLVSSHVLGEVSQLADDVVIINRGRLVTQSTVAEVTAGGDRTRVRSPDVTRLREAVAAAGLVDREAGTDALVVEAAPARVGELAAAKGIVLHELVAEKATLEEAFLELVGGGG